MDFLQAERSVTLEAVRANLRLVQRTPSDAFDWVDIQLDQDCSASSPEVLRRMGTYSFHLQSIRGLGWPRQKAAKQHQQDTQASRNHCILVH
jgi:hypothetical protein